MTFVVAANTATSGRSGTLTVAGQTVTVTQAGATPACTFSLSPPNQSVPATGGFGTVTVVASPASCAWTAAWTPASASTWVTTNSGATGTGNGAVQRRVAANPGSSPRSATLTVGGQTFTVNQAAAPAACTFSFVAAESIGAGDGGLRHGHGRRFAGHVCVDGDQRAEWVSITAGATGPATGRSGSRSRQTSI